MGKDWYKPQTSIDYGPDKRRLIGEKVDKRKAKGARNLKSMHLDKVSDSSDVTKLNTYLNELRNAIYNLQIDGDKILPNTISSTQIAQHSVAGSCLAETLELDGDLWIHGWISAGEYISAGSGFFTHGDLYVNDISATGNISADILHVVDYFSAAGNLSADNVIAGGFISAAGNVSAASGDFENGVVVGYLSCTGNAVVDDVLYVNADYTGGDQDAGIFFNATTESIIFDYGNSRFQFSDDIYSVGSGAFPQGTATGYLSSTGTVEALSVWPQNGWTGWFDDGVNFRTFVSAGIITGVENSIAGGHS